jgi:predicted ABC-type ATPase
MALTMNVKKNVYIFAGVNGAGKSTFANKYLSKFEKNIINVNADLIAHAFSPYSSKLTPKKARRVILNQIQSFAAKGINFGFETTLSGKSYISFFKMLKGNGYHLNLFFLWVPSPEFSSMRIIKRRGAKNRFYHPGEDSKNRLYRSLTNLCTKYRPFLFFLWIPDIIPVVSRKKNKVGRYRKIRKPNFEKEPFHEGVRKLFKLYRPVLDSWKLIDNTSLKPSLIAKEENKKLTIVKKLLFNQILLDAKIKL